MEQGEPSKVGPRTSDRSVQARGANGPTKAILAQPLKEGGQGQDGLDCIRPSNMFLLFYFLFSVLFQIQGPNSNLSFHGTFIFTLNVQFEHSLNFISFFLFCILEYFSLSYFQIRI